MKKETRAANLDSLVGKHVRFACSVEYIRTTYREDDSCFDRVFLVPEGEAVEIDIWGYSAEDRKKQKEMFQRRKAKFVNCDDELDEVLSGETKEPLRRCVILHRQRERS